MQNARSGVVGIALRIAACMVFLSLFGSVAHAQTITRTVAANWNAVSTPNIAGYNVYRGATQNGSFTKLNAAPLTGTTFSDSSVSANTTYWYYVTSICPAAGCVNNSTTVITGESLPSTKVSAVVPPDPTISQPPAPGGLTVTVTVNVSIP